MYGAISVLTVVPIIHVIKWGKWGKWGKHILTVEQDTRIKMRIYG